MLSFAKAIWKLTLLPKHLTHNFGVGVCRKGLDVKTGDHRDT